MSIHSNRTSGILLHPTSLPGPFGIGDLGPESYRFIDWLERAGARIWQVLPLNPPGYGNSPYACLSAFAGNPLLISPEGLRDDGLLTQEELEGAHLPEGRIQFEAATTQKQRLLQLAYERFQLLEETDPLRDSFRNYCEAEQSWLDGWCKFRTLKTVFGGRHWREWSVTPTNANSELTKHPVALERTAFEQFMFDRQWSALRAYAAKKQIHLVGDMPLFVADDSADTWTQRNLFTYDQNGQPTSVAGVPPDYFSATGQLWGNPQYNWTEHEREGFSWWIARIARVLQHTDIVRIDHFRGLAASWHIPAGAPNAISGKWIKAPGAKMLQAVRDALGKAPLIAEDLGLITPDVEELRDAFALPGMKVLQFAWADDAFFPFLPHTYPHNCIVYTGTHDNNTSAGWYRHDATDKERDYLRKYLCVAGNDVAWDLIRAAWRSTADVAIAPLQDVLALDSEHRMNLPGSESGNWNWRFLSGQLNNDYAKGLRLLTELYGRTIQPTAKDETPAGYPL